eukprot:CAMPEP_0185768032 /NCGR_PEP_ID=MMETSP1174-20130828/46771_1 /TAXON_ID=35687 /ORGANISM="Dictyocha speculum, Strain CCMP1381" /LENGTH=216 /DNA_ID=CAMNT_0028452499 /DNA_START=27 /DNA_END=677 /DNA_ORIENTATION=+
MMRRVSTIFLLACLSATTAFQPQALKRSVNTASAQRPFRNVATLARRKGDLFQEIADINDAKKLKEAGGGESTESAKSIADKQAAILAPETIEYEGPPSWTEVVVPAISILTVIGIIPFAAAVSRQAWVRYKITSRRISVTSGFNGADLTEVTYDEIFLIKYIFRLGGCGDMVIELRDGAKLEMRSVPNFDELYRFILSKVDDETREASDQIKAAE